LIGPSMMSRSAPRPVMPPVTPHRIRPVYPAIRQSEARLNWVLTVSPKTS